MTPLRIVYLVLAAAGAIWPWSHNVAFAATHGGLDLGAFIAEAFSTPAGGSLSADIFIAATTGCVWMVAESRRLGMRHAWVFVVLALVVAFACAFPLFLFLREGKLAAARPGA